MPQLTREKIIAEHKRRMGKVPTPEWDGDPDGFVYVRELMADEQLALMADKADELGQMVQVCILGICTKAGEPLLTQADEKRLRQGRLAPLGKCAEAILELSGVTDRGVSDSKKGSRRQGRRSRSS